MASNSIKIFDDTVIKLSINQGLEEQRSNEILGNFTNGELAFTRDTGRLFVGDNSDGEPGHIGLQETIGGSLVGNKYLGLIDSKPLVTFYNNGEPLSFEETTTITGTQELNEFQEPGLLLADSKFRLHSADRADEKWDNWDRTAVYNSKYNAYNGDFMFDVYRNALILFDNRISGDPNSITQPQVKKDGNNQPVSPETFIVDGEEIESTDIKALSLTRRSQLKNYSKENEDSTNSNLVYGDGYVILRIVEPDNQTIRFKTRSFQQNGLPENENNYTHNLLEVFHVPTNALAGNFSDDFIVDEFISLNKDIASVNSITGVNGNIKIPGTLSFSTPLEGTRGATTYMQWTMLEPQGITVPSNDTYKLVFKAKELKKDNGKDFISFNTELEAEKPYIYNINLDGLESNQDNPATLVLDEKATSDDINAWPTLKVTKLKETILYNENSDPYQVDTDDTIFYTGNIGVDDGGIVTLIDSFDSAYASAAKDKIERWEEENISINFLKKPITILQSSTASNLYKESTEKFTASNYTLPSTQTSATLSNITVDNDIEKLVELITAANQFHIAKNTGTDTVTNGVNFSSTQINIPTISQATGLCGILSGSALTNKKYIKSITISGKVTGLAPDDDAANNGTIKLFCALINNKKIVKSGQIEKTYKDFLFGFSLNLDEVLVSGNSFIALGFIAAGGDASDVTIVYDNVSIIQRGVDDEEIFTLSDIGVNVNVDYNVSPYVYCAKKTVSTPISTILPTIERTADYPTNLSTNYFTSFTGTNIKTWNNLVTVLGHNHYANLKNTASEAILGQGYESIVKNSCFKYLSAYDVQKSGSNLSVTTHTSITDPDDTGSMAFSWYKEYNKSGQQEQNVKYYPHEAFETRSTVTIQENTNEIDYVKVQGSETNLISQTNNGVVTGQEVEISTGLFRKQYAIYTDSTLLSHLQSYIEYGMENGIHVVYDFKKYKDFHLAYRIPVDAEATKVTFIKSDNSNISYNNGQVAQKFPNGITVDSTFETSGSDKVGQCKYVVFTYSETIEGQVEEYYETYSIIQNVSYVSGFDDPSTLSNVSIVNGSGTTQTVTIDESVDDEDKVFIPTHARTILLEFSHVTTENNTVAVMYANRFEDLGLILPGLPVEEYNNPQTFSADVIINPSHSPSISDGGYVNKNGTYKLKLGGTVSTGAKAFHDISKSVEENKKCIPSIYAPAPGEKVMINTSSTETRVIEVPLHKIPGTDTRHFALRFANIRPSNSEILNQVVVRVIGYRL